MAYFLFNYCNGVHITIIGYSCQGENDVDDNCYGKRWHFWQLLQTWQDMAVVVRRYHANDHNQAGYSGSKGIHLQNNLGKQF